ncbi:MAG: hemerythrin domain-containing protein [Deltaproteobacteria bacterium]|nr:MAG: hemerythrin domain-containing protein [Deltaproteobacteria bacterium]
MKPSEVRKRILEEHAALRRLLAEVEGLAERYEDGSADLAPMLLERGRTLYESLAAHLDVEDAYLAPALRAAGAEGERRAESLAHEHREQRELLRYLLGRIHELQRPTILIAREVRSFVGYVRVDMEHEEKTILSEAVFRD